MNLESQVTSLEISKKLKSLNVKQQSLFYWIKRIDKLESIRIAAIIYSLNLIDLKEPENYELCSAFTASELMELLPQKISLPEKYQPFDCYRFMLERSVIVEDDGKICPTFIINYVCDTYDPMRFAPGRLFYNIWDKSLCNALAKMLIHQRETKLSEILEPTSS